MRTSLPAQILTALQAVDTPTICNAIEAVEGKRRNTGFTRTPVICADPALPAMVGFVKTAQIRSDKPSPETPDVLRERRLNLYIQYFRAK